MLALFEVRVWEAEEDFAELGFLEEVWEKLHGVCADAGCVLVAVCCCVLDAQGADFFLHVFCY